MCLFHSIVFFLSSISKIIWENIIFLLRPVFRHLNAFCQILFLPAYTVVDVWMLHWFVHVCTRFGASRCFLPECDGNMNAWTWRVIACLSLGSYSHIIACIRVSLERNFACVQYTFLGVQMCDSIVPMFSICVFKLLDVVEHSAFLSSNSFLDF